MRQYSAGSAHQKSVLLVVLPLICLFGGPICGVQAVNGQSDVPDRTRAARQSNVQVESKDRSGANNSDPSAQTAGNRSLNSVPTVSASSGASAPLDSKGAFSGRRAGDRWSKNGPGIEFCWCPAGKFLMGSPLDEPEREFIDEQTFNTENQVHVTLTRGFWIAKYEVTQAEWEQVMGTNPSTWSKTGKNEAQLDGVSTDRFPVETVSWQDAMEFCGKLTEQEHAAGRLPADWKVSLPTEAQWEYACRAGTTTATAFGDRLSSRDANFDGTFPYNGADEGPDLGRPTTVGSYPANAWGLHDMHGNVAEWCLDSGYQQLPGGTDPLATSIISYDTTFKEFTGTMLDPVELHMSRVNRGGGWFNEGHQCRSAAHTEEPPTYASAKIGLRLTIVHSPPVPFEGKQAGQQWTLNTLGMRFSWCPPDVFMMGSPTEERYHSADEDQVKVALTRGFWLGVYEVTQQEREHLMDVNPSYFQNGGYWGEKVKDIDTSLFPVELVSWSQATEYCRKLTEREHAAGNLPLDWKFTLPTEAQWEYACRAGTTTATAFGDDLSGNEANFDAWHPYSGHVTSEAPRMPSWQRTIHVGYYEPNAWGFADMHGNVYEWCLDVYGEKHVGGTDPIRSKADSTPAVPNREPNVGSLLHRFFGPDGPDRVFRGGNWQSHGDVCLSATRASGGPSSPPVSMGLRVAIVHVDDTPRGDR